MTTINLSAKQQYHERCRQQTLKWAMGHSYHNTIDDECCPDFSCCDPTLFETDQAKRWELFYRDFGQRQ